MSTRDSPNLWLTFSTTVTQLTILLYGTVRFFRLMAFCQAANTSGEHSWIKNILIILLYSYAPFCVISVTFTWVAYGQDWASGWFFMWLPFPIVLLFFTTVVVTKNDISNQVDVQRAARSKLPFQPLPPPMKVPIPMPGTSNVIDDGTVAIEVPPPLPMQQRTQYIIDDDAL